MTAELTWTLPAALLELPLLPVELSPAVLPVLAFSLLEVQVNLPWMTPLPPWEPGAFFFSSVQASLMSLVEDRAKVPLTSSRLGNSTLEMGC